MEVTPRVLECQGASTSEEVREAGIETIRHAIEVIDELPEHEADGPDVAGTEVVRMEESGIREEEGWVDEFTRVCSTHLPPNHPCLEFLRRRGMDLGMTADFDRFAGNPSPLGGKRWYLAVTVKGRTAEFLVDTGASHSIISRRFYSSLPGTHDDFKLKVNACTADGSRMQTYGRTVLPIGIGGGEYVFSPTITDISDDGIIGLDFAALYGAVLEPARGCYELNTHSR